jgi:hypothetical protein
MKKYSKRAHDKIGEVMHEFQEGTLKSGKNGRGGKVMSRKQAIAIGISEARKAGLKVPPEKAAKRIALKSVAANYNLFYI